jgi:hypothetical protein
MFSSGQGAPIGAPFVIELDLGDKLSRYFVLDGRSVSINLGSCRDSILLIAASHNTGVCPSKRQVYDCQLI